MRKQVADAGAKGLVLGLSGGLDSSAVAALCNKAFPDDTLALIMPCHSPPDDVEDALKLAEVLNVSVETVRLEEVYDRLIKHLGESGKPGDADGKLALANIKPRLRMTVLYYYASRHSYLVAGTSNKSEISIGYTTKYGDSAVDIQPIAHLLKTEVMDIAQHLGIPEEIIKKPPSAGLWDGQTDEEEIGFTYDELDRYLMTGEGDPGTKEKIEQMMGQSEHKRKMAPTCLKIKDF